MDIIDKLLTTGEAHARKILLELRQKELTPLYHIVSGGKEPDALIPCHFANNIEKQITFLNAKNIARNMKAIAGMFIGESWMLSVPEDRIRTIDQEPRPSQHPDRIEVVMLVATTGRETRSRSLRIIRNKQGRIIDLVTDPIDPGIISGGMIDGLIEPQPAH